MVDELVGTFVGIPVGTNEAGFDDSVVGSEVG